MSGESDFEELLPAGDLDAPGSRAEPISEFKPWHHPRKQYVRSHQWGAAIESLVDELTDRHVLSYLCLPGEDMLDVGVLADLCHRKGRRLRYLGYDTALQAPSQSTQRIASMQIVGLKPSVERESLVVPDDFSSISNQQSNGYRYLKNGGTYDVVNLDLCDSFTSEVSPQHAALMGLVAHQCGLRAEPWLLFLTTRSEFGRVAQSERAVYLGLLSRNADQSAVFLSLLGEVLGREVERPLPLGVLEEVCSVDAAISGRVLSLGIGKWLAGIVSQPEIWRVDLLSIWSYRTGVVSARAEEFARGPANLFSLAFRFTKVIGPRHDPNGLAGRVGGGIPPTEVQLAEKMAKCVRQYARDLDVDLERDNPLMMKLQTECEELLAARNYSLPHYREWLAGAGRSQMSLRRVEMEDEA